MKTVLLSCLFLLVTVDSALAQVSPDRSLQSHTRVIKQGNTTLIKAGTVRGSNLFHSFRDFSIPAGRTTYFTNSPDIQNIFSRVTGGSISNIDGNIRANGTANLFLLNPNGIIFGPSARLNIGGSFLASTANEINFADGIQFSASNSSATPLLTVDVPVGLRFSSTTRSIAVQGKGHDLQFANPQAPVASPIIGTGEGLTGLKVAPGKALALIGGQTTLSGGILTAPSGQIEIASVGEGTVGLDLTLNGFTFDYSNLSKFQDTQLAGRSLIDTSGIFNGQVNLQSNNLFLSDSSLIIVSNFGSQRLGEIKINAVESIEFRGVTDPAKIDFSGSRVPFGGIVAQNFSTGTGAGINITSKSLKLRDFSVIDSFNYGKGQGGDIVVDVQDTLQVLGSPPVEFSFFPSAISSFTIDGDAGSLKVSGKFLSIQDGGLMLSQTFGLGKGGEINANFSEGIDISGSFSVNPKTNSIIPSALGSTTTANGQAGNVTINTKQLKIENGGKIPATTSAFGDAGDITINAQNSVEVKGKSLFSTDGALFNRSQIVSAADKTNNFLFQLFNTPTIPQGDSGQITINTNRLNIQDGGQITVENDGSGVAGAITVNASTIRLDNLSGITASTALGQGGNLDLQARDIILLQNRSSISTSAREIRPDLGPSISIVSDLLAISRNSNISANAQTTQGGQVFITTQGIIPPTNNITATSQLGPQFSGTIEINAPEVDFARASDTPIITPESPQISSSCQSSKVTKASSFTNIGAGGIPPGPNDPLTSNVLWEDDSSPSQQASLNSQVPDRLIIPSSANKYVEAQGWKSNSDGTVDFVTDTTETLDHTALSANSCK